MRELSLFWLGMGNQALLRQLNGRLNFLDRIIRQRQEALSELIAELDMLSAELLFLESALRKRSSAP
jgi:hypothetical protein